MMKTAMKFKTKPSYEKMVKRILKKSHRYQKGESYQTMMKWITERYETPEESIVRRNLIKKLKEMDEQGIIVKTHDKAHMYKLSKETRKELKKERESRKINKPKRTRTLNRTTKVKRKAINRGGFGFQPKKSLYSPMNIGGSTTTTTTTANHKHQHKWQFLNNYNMYEDYDINASDQVEDVFLQYKTDPTAWELNRVYSGTFHYFVNFRTMVQQNVDHSNHTVRKIRRVSV